MGKITSFVDLITYFNRHTDKKNLIFRGQGDKNWKLVPKSGRSGYLEYYADDLSEKFIFQAWMRYAKAFIPKDPDNLWDWLAIAQHYGLATRLLDWSKNPLVAAYFACSEELDKDGVIFICQVSDFNPPIKDPFDFKGVSIFFPTGLASRIISQRGVFTISDTPSKPISRIKSYAIEKIEIEQQAKSEILNALSFYNINKFSLFQDLQSLSEFLNDYVVSPRKNKSLEDIELSLSSEI